MHEVLVNRLGGLSLPRKSVVRLTDRPDMTLDVYRGRKTTMQQYRLSYMIIYAKASEALYMFWFHGCSVTASLPCAISLFNTVEKTLIQDS